MKRLLVLPLLVSAALAHGAQPAPAKADPAKGQQVAAGVCAGCHGPDGNSAIPANPKLAGQFEDYLAKQLRNFRAPEGNAERRVSPIMNGMAATISEDDVRNVAAFYASQALKPEAAKSKQVETAQKLWRAGDSARNLPACAGCHGPAGAGVPAQFPRLQGQFPEYTEAQLKAFRDGARANDSNKMMRMIAAKMSDNEIKAIADYIAGLR